MSKNTIKMRAQEKGGVVTVKASIAPNDTPGLWRIQVCELASGLTTDAYLSVRTDF